MSQPFDLNTYVTGGGAKGDDQGPRAAGTNPDSATLYHEPAAHGDHRDGDHHGLVAHHFAELEQQHEATTLGMWVFLATEVLFIGAIFVAYFCYRFNLLRRLPRGERDLVQVHRLHSTRCSC